MAAEETAGPQKRFYIEQSGIRLDLSTEEWPISPNGALVIASAIKQIREMVEDSSDHSHLSLKDVIARARLKVERQEILDRSDHMARMDKVVTDNLERGEKNRLAAQIIASLKSAEQDLP